MNYQRIYDSLIAKAKERKLNEYFEIHHVIPKCLNGDDSKDNLVKLTAKEHFIAHYILWKIHRNSKLFYAFNNMRMKSDNQKICDNTNQELKGIKIKNTKKINNSGNNHKNEKVILIYNKSNEIVFIKEKFINFNVFCENNDLDYNKLCKTYRRNNINKNYNYYARIKAEDGI